MGFRPLKPIAKRTLQDSVHEQLKQALMSGLFAPGASMTLRGAAAQLGTSVMPIRDAVRRLVSDGALEMPTSRHIRVPLLSLARYDSVLRLRQLLECEAVARAAVRADRVDLDTLVALNERVHVALRAVSLPRFLDANREFHFAVYALAADPLLLSLIEKTWLLTGPYLGLMEEAFTPELTRGRPVLSEHEALLKALRSRDAKAARVAISGDIRNGASLYRDRIQALSATAPDSAPPRMRARGTVARR